MSTLDYIDFEKVDALLEGFNKATGFVTAILDLEGNVLSKSGWRRICTEFHRVNPETSRRCTISDTVLAGKMAEGEKYHFYRCLNGLVDVAVPIVIGGEHAANLFSGQFFFDAPDPAFFEAQAKTFGFDRGSYLEALNRVPVVSKEKVQTAMDFLLTMTQIINEMAFQRLEQAQLAEAIKANEEHLRRTQEIAKLGSWHLDIATNEVFWTEQLYRMYGFDPSLPPPPFTEHAKLFVPESWERLSSAIARTRETGIPYILELKTVREDGSNGWMWVRGEAEKDAEGRTTGFWGAALDITERKHSEEVIRSLNASLESRVAERTAQLESANREMEAFTYSVSHDLRAPLRAIDGYCHFLEEDYAEKLDDEGKRLLGIVRKNAIKMDKLILDLLDLSRISKNELANAPVDMERLARDVYAELADVAGDEGYSLEIAPLPSIEGDSSLLRQVWANLIGNAIKYSRKSPIKRIEISSAQESGFRIYTIKDYGAGFEPEYADKLFNPFQRLHKPEDFEGNGIGLALVHRIVSRHKGRTWAESAGPGKGAAFHFALPFKE
jgi:PAS domain S-box-containing protein